MRQRQLWWQRPQLLAGKADDGGAGQLCAIGAAVGVVVVVVGPLASSKSLWANIVAVDGSDESDRLTAEIVVMYHVEWSFPLVAAGGGSRLPDAGCWLPPSLQTVGAKPAAAAYSRVVADAGSIGDGVLAAAVDRVGGGESD